MKWLTRLKKNTVPPAPYEIEHRSEQEYRERCIREFAAYYGKSLAESAAFLDMWEIREVSSIEYLDDSKIPSFVPTPLWDDEWMLVRDGFPTHDQALAYVNRVGGALLPPEE